MRRRRLDFCSDATLLRYLRARDSNEEKALAALTATLEWRARHVDPSALAMMQLQRRRRETGGWAKPPLTEFGSADGGRKKSSSPKGPTKEQDLVEGALLNGTGGRWDYYEDSALLAPGEDGRTWPGAASQGGGVGGVTVATPFDEENSDMDTSLQDSPSPVHTPRRSLAKAFDGMVTQDRSMKRAQAKPPTAATRAILDANDAPSRTGPSTPRPLPWTSSAPCCESDRADPCAHCFYRVGMDRLGRHVIYSCAGRARNKVVYDNCMHMAFELERIFDHGAADGKVVWVIDFRGFGIRDCNPNMGANALPMYVPTCRASRTVGPSVRHVFFVLLSSSYVSIFLRLNLLPMQHMQVLEALSRADGADRAAGAPRAVLRALVQRAARARPRHEEQGRHAPGPTRTPSLFRRGMERHVAGRATTRRRRKCSGGDHRCLRPPRPKHGSVDRDGGGFAGCARLVSGSI